MNGSNIQSPRPSNIWDSALAAALVGALVGALIGGVVSYGVSSIQEGQHQNYVAQALYTDISVTSDVLNLSLTNYNNYKKNNPSNLTVFISPSPFYTEHGLYFIYSSDVSKFDSNLSNEIFLYYYNVMMIENERRYLEDHFSAVMNKGNLTEEKEMEEQVFVSYSSGLPEQINSTIQLGETAKKQLKEKHTVVNNSIAVYEVKATNASSFFANYTYW